MTSGLGAPLGARSVEVFWSGSPTQGQECEDVWSGSPIQQAPWKESAQAPTPGQECEDVSNGSPESVYTLCARPAWPRRGPALASWAGRPGWESGVGMDVWSGDLRQGHKCEDVWSGSPTQG